MTKSEMCWKFSLSLSTILRIENDFKEEHKNFSNFKRNPQKLINSSLIQQKIKEYIDNSNHPYTAKEIQHEIKIKLKILIPLHIIRWILK